MKVFAKRTVSLVEPEGDYRAGKAGLTLHDFISERGYVLLGEPGMGKSTAFELEANRVDALPPVPARRFISRSPECHPEWRKGPLFIDGLDEVRAGSGDPRTAVDRIVARLEDLGTPHFRISCRAGSWLGPGDLKEFRSLVDDDNIPVLQLDPITLEDVRQIVSRQGGNADTFVIEAIDHRMEAFLRNPQLLGILLESANSEGWPDNPGSAFEKACRKLTREQNSEHKDARSNLARSSPEAVLRAAGELCALSLIAGKTGWTVAGADSPEALPLREMESEHIPSHHAALDSSLFAGSSRCRAPIHRLLAEYLGARYLDERIRARSGVSVRRALALLLGHDGKPLPDLRGLAAWLAALNRQARPMLIRTDPVAVAFNGDASSFTPRERRELLERLERSINLMHTWPSAAALGALAGYRGRSALWELTDASERSERRQMLIYLLLSGLAGMQPRAGSRTSPEASSDDDRGKLLRIARDFTWQSDIRCLALRALSRVLTGSSHRGATLRELLEEIQEKRLSDQAYDLRGTLLALLYPGELQPAEVWNYLAAPAASGYGPYQKFWAALVDRSEEEQIRELLDALCTRASDVMPKLEGQRLEGTALDLLAKGLESFGDELSIGELYRWFELVEFDLQLSKLTPATSRHRLRAAPSPGADASIRGWLGERPAVQRALIERGLLALKSDIGAVLLSKTIGLKFVGKDAPAGFRSWCLARAAELSATHQDVAEELAWWSVRQQEGWGAPLSDDIVARAVEGVAGLRAWNARRLAGRDQSERMEAEWKKSQAEFLQPFLQEQQERVDQIRRHATELAEGRCPPALLHELASVYFDGLAEEGPGHGPRAHLANELDRDESLVQAALSGFRSLLSRDDLPDLEQIADLHESGELSYFALPYLAGAEEEEAATGDALGRLGERGMRRALGFYFATDVPRQRYRPGIVLLGLGSERPPWYLRALNDHPEAVADALVAMHGAGVRTKAPPDWYQFDLAFNRAYDRVRPLAVRRMFTPFPTRCSKPQLESLRLVLWSALDTCGMADGELQDLVMGRLQRTGMDVGQRALWLSAGLFVARDSCLPRLADFLAAGAGARVRHVIGFLAPEDRRQRFALNVGDWHAQEAEQLIRELGSRVSRFEAPKGPSWYGDEQLAGMNFQPLIASWAQALSGSAGEDAARALDSLVSDPELVAWKPELARAQESQAGRRRAATRQELTLAQIQHVLRGGPPASAADLAALTVDCLEQLAERIRNGPTSDWRQYWHRDRKSGKPIAPQNENDCRDALLSDLEEMLSRHEISALAEGRYADDRRADIRVSHGPGLAIPIEIKKNSHHAIWRAITEQLAAKYARDPRSGGYGIYLVLWFGAGPTHMRVVSPRGDVPGSPEELKRLLEAQLPPALTETIHVVVIDVCPAGRYAEEQAALASA